jgi:IclR family transcriptional regulator, acetate operon repressor
MQDLSQLPPSSTLRAISVIELIARAEAPVSLDELTLQSGLPKPTVFRILALLVRGGVVSRESIEKRYVVGPRLARIALKVQMNSPTRAWRHSILVRLVEEIGETCNFTMLDGNDVVYLDRVETSSPVRLHMDAGSRVPLHCTASGKLFLSQMTSRELRRVLGNGPLKRYTERTITSIDALERALRKVRADGVGTDIGEYLEGSVCLAVPVNDPDGRMCAVVALHGPAPRMTLKKGIEYLPALRRAAKALSETFGDESAKAHANAIARPMRKVARVSA